MLRGAGVVEHGQSPGGFRWSGRNLLRVTTFASRNSTPAWCCVPFGEEAGMAVKYGGGATTKLRCTRLTGGHAGIKR
jgi:hypothetical protein